MSVLDRTILEIHKAYINKEVTPLELTLEAIKRAKEDKNNAIKGTINDVKESYSYDKNRFKLKIL